MHLTVPLNNDTMHTSCYNFFMIRKYGRTTYLSIVLLLGTIFMLLFGITHNTLSRNISRTATKQEVANSRNYTSVLVRVDERKRSNSQVLKERINILRSFPRQPFMINDQSALQSRKCANFPSLRNLKFDNNWQVLETPHGSAFIYGAYFDNRKQTLNSNDSRSPVVRILGMMEANLCLDKSIKYYCQLWFENKTQPIISPVTDTRYHKSYKNEKHRMFLFSCKSSNSVPASVSLVVNPYDNATNNLRVQYEKASKKKLFGVCVKGLDFFHEDHSVRIVEWIELLRLLGANKIYFYEFAQHPNATKVLRYYQNKNFADVTPLTLPGGLPNDPGLRHIYLNGRLTEQIAHEMIPYNDCFYRNLYKYKYLAMLDTDEVIVPLKDLMWTKMINNLRSRHGKRLDSFSAICFRNTYFFGGLKTNFPDIPEYMHTLQHVYRTNHTRTRGFAKCFHNTEEAIVTYNHYPTQCFGKCKRYYFNKDDAQLQHYRQGCPAHMKNCLDDFEKSALLDTNLWRYKDKLINRTLHVLSALGFIPRTFDPRT